MRLCLFAESAHGLSPTSKECVQHPADTDIGFVHSMQELSLAVGSCFDMDPDLAPEDALAQLDDLAGQTDIIVERCTKLNSCQEQCSVAQTDFKDPALLHRY